MFQHEILLGKIGMVLARTDKVNSGFSSNPRINLSPFTKDFRV